MVVREWQKITIVSYCFIFVKLFWSLVPALLYFPHGIFPNGLRFQTKLSSPKWCVYYIRFFENDPEKCQMEVTQVHNLCKYLK